ncbi:hypothetical protein LSAT2_000770 [Lamellibrachia satsuma]|nr:hypothetical protein LSAT2_000770 [Lamellibrachia satsuma]
MAAAQVYLEIIINMKLSWQPHINNYGDDYDEDSDRPVSVLKEHTVLTDTYV